MSADQITPERIAELRERAMTGGPTKAWRRSDYLAVLDALTASRAEVQRLTEESRRSDAGRVEVPELTWQDMVDAVDPNDRRDRFAIGYAFARSRSRLSPSPQAAPGAVAWLYRRRLDTGGDAVWATAYEPEAQEEAQKHGGEVIPLYERPAPHPLQPEERRVGPDEVVVGREELDLLESIRNRLAVWYPRFSGEDAVIREAMAKLRAPRPQQGENTIRETRTT